MKRSTPLSRKTPLRHGKPLERRAISGSGSSLKQGKPSLKRTVISPASPAQRKKARDEPCIVTGTTSKWNTVDPAHLWAAGRGGCKDPLCVVPLVREVHRRFDNGDFDLLPYLVRRRVPELLHALEHAEGDLLGLLHRLTGERFVPSSETETLCLDCGGVGERDLWPGGPMAGVDCETCGGTGRRGNSVE